MAEWGENHYSDETIRKYKSRRSFFKDGQRKPWFTFLLWAFPMSFGAFGFYCQSVQLHYATYSYVQRVHAEKALMTKVNWEHHNDLFVKLPDPLADSFGPQEKVNIGVLDLVAGMFPAGFVLMSSFCGIFYCREHLQGPILQVWTKVFLCAGLLFIVKGMIGAMTTVPDSSGWEVCAERLGKDGVHYMEDDHTFWQMFFLDFQWNVLWYHHPLRYCSDMMYSGHTFVVTLFALGCYEMLRLVMEVKEDNQAFNDKDKQIQFGTDRTTYYCGSDHTADCGWDGVCGPNDGHQCESCRRYQEKVKRSVGLEKKLFNTSKLKLKLALLTALAVVSIVQQSVEIYAVLLSRFHYSSDVLVALLMTFLLYTNGAIAISAKQWATRGVYFFVGRYPPTVKGRKLCPEKEWKDREMWVTRGDAYLPICCFPFCCFAGRQHIYTDIDMENIACTIDAHTGNELHNELYLGEGVSMKDARKLLPAVAKKLFFGAAAVDSDLKEKLLPGNPPAQQKQTIKSRGLDMEEDPEEESNSGILQRRAGLLLPQANTKIKDLQVEVEGLKVALKAAQGPIKSKEEPREAAVDGLKAKLQAATKQSEFLQKQQSDQASDPVDLRVVIRNAEGLENVNMNGNNFQCRVELQHAVTNQPERGETRTSHSRTSKSKSPVWDESFEFSHYQPGESLIFTIWDASGVCAHAILPADHFYPHAHPGPITMEMMNSSDAKLSVDVNVTPKQKQAPVTAPVPVTMAPQRDPVYTADEHAAIRRRNLELEKAVVQQDEQLQQSRIEQQVWADECHKYHREKNLLEQQLTELESRQVQPEVAEEYQRQLQELEQRISLHSDDLLREIPALEIRLANAINLQAMVDGDHRDASRNLQTLAAELARLKAQAQIEEQQSQHMRDQDEEDLVTLRSQLVFAEQQLSQARFAAPRQPQAAAPSRELEETRVELAQLKTQLSSQQLIARMQDDAAKKELMAVKTKLAQAEGTSDALSRSNAGDSERTAISVSRRQVPATSQQIYPFPTLQAGRMVSGAAPQPVPRHLVAASQGFVTPTQTLPGSTRRLAMPQTAPPLTTVYASAAQPQPRLSHGSSGPNGSMLSPTMMVQQPIGSAGQSPYDFGSQAAASAQISSAQARSMMVQQQSSGQARQW